MNQFRNPDGQLLLDFGREDGTEVYYSFGADGLYDALTMENKDLVGEMKELLSYNSLSQEQIVENPDIAYRFALLSDKYINRNPELYREYISQVKFNTEFIKYITKNIDTNDLTRFDANQAFCVYIDSKLVRYYNIKAINNMNATIDIFEFVKRLNHPFLEKSLENSVKKYIEMFVDDSPFAALKPFAVLKKKELFKLKDYKNENTEDDEDDLDGTKIFSGNIDHKFSTLYFSFFAQELEDFCADAEDLDSVKSTKEGILTHFFSFVVDDILKQVDAYITLYKDTLNIKNMEDSLGAMKKNLGIREKELSFRE